jgi:hypothetical protein
LASSEARRALKLVMSTFSPRTSAAPLLSLLVLLLGRLSVRFSAAPNGLPELSIFIMRPFVDYFGRLLSL